MNLLSISIYAVITMVAIFNGTPLMASWSSPVTLTSYANQATTPDLAVNATGYAIAVWSEFNGQNIKIRSATKSSNAGWSGITDLSTIGEDSYNPMVAMNAAGNAVVVWESYSVSNSKINVKMREFGGSWSDIVILSDPSISAANAKVAIDSIGNIVVVWEKYDGDSVGIQAIRRTYYGVWSAPEDISEPYEYAFQPQVTTNSTGSTIAIWTGFDGTNLNTECASYSINGVWSNPTYLSIQGYDAMNPQVAINNYGSAVAIWSGFDGNNFITQASILPSNGNWSFPMYLSEPGEDAYNAQVAIDPSGNGVAIWTRNDGENLLVESSSLFSNYSATLNSYFWTDPVSLSDSGQDSASPMVAVDPSGNAIAVWTRLNGTNFVLQTATLPFGGSWSSSVDHSDPTLDAITPAIVIDSTGDATIIWAENFSYYVIQSIDGSEFF